MNMKKLILLFCFVISKVSIADCFDIAVSYYQIDSNYLRAIAWQKSKFNPKTKNKNEDDSFYLGIMQINTKMFKSIKNEYPSLLESA
ncbi:MAG: transglycosylase SLT domain-containing protein [Candidatus Phlomobacter fragariae]